MWENEPILLRPVSHVFIGTDWLCELGKPLTTVNSAFPSRQRQAMMGGAQVVPARGLGWLGRGRVAFWPSVSLSLLLLF